MNVTVNGPFCVYSIISAKKTVTNNIPTPSAQREFPRPLHGPADQARILPLGVATTQP